MPQKVTKTDFDLWVHWFGAKAAIAIAEGRHTRAEKVDTKCDGDEVGPEVHGDAACQTVSLSPGEGGSARGPSQLQLASVDCAKTAGAADDEFLNGEPDVADDVVVAPVAPHAALPGRSGWRGM